MSTRQLYIADFASTHHEYLTVVIVQVEISAVVSPAAKLSSSHSGIHTTCYYVKIWRHPKTQKYIIIIIIIIMWLVKRTLQPSQQATCLSVCLSVCLSLVYLRNHTSKPCEILCACTCGLVLLSSMLHIEIHERTDRQTDRQTCSSQYFTPSQRRSLIFYRYECANSTMAPPCLTFS